ncbi:response regulator transcription factor [Sporosarcina trichiuri]|uniref:response regulator transcription factor n=1 Tax=Sporosarcina trichiuri TaxID=3056445 RepID=UPI0025B307A4|nr:response regulator transcription factor [Sporosarcina sp. 0.2-SM1T-5]WJY26445.1 response regulator transcription factor [Sporosarcina sp. 0.2-SM1T-5]
MEILIIDHRPIVRSGLRTLLSDFPGFHICGEAISKEEAIPFIRQSPPDLLIANWCLGTLSGLELIQEVRTNGYCGKSLVLAESVTQQEFYEVKTSKVDGLLASTATEEEFMCALNLIRLGRTYYDSQLLVNLLANTADKKPENPPHDQLTNKELEVLQALGQGLSNRQIAGDLFVTEFTVKKHVSQVLAKLGLADRTHAALYANAKGIARYEVSV